MIRGQRSRGSQFKASLGKQFSRPYLKKKKKKKPSQKRVEGVVQGVDLEFKPQCNTQKCI
jgi:hypothetical protein